VDDNEERKKLYDDTAKRVFDANMRGNLSVGEMSFLLSLLDQVMMKRQYPDLVQLLREWKDSKADEEINLIIKETLINIDFNNQKSVIANLDIIKDLLGVQGGQEDA